MIDSAGEVAVIEPSAWYRSCSSLIDMYPLEKRLCRQGSASLTSSINIYSPVLTYSGTQDTGSEATLRLYRVP